MVLLYAVKILLKIQMMKMRENFKKLLQVIERIAAMGVTNTEELPYYKIN